MKLGLLARADKTGLGYQTKAYYDWLKPDHTMLIDIQELNGNEQHYGWYPDAYIVKGFPNIQNIKSFLNKIDVLLTAESPYNYEFYRRARIMGVKTVCVYNPEFFDWFTHPEYETPDVLINPSVWMWNLIDKWAKHNRVQHVQLHHPVDRKEFPFRQRTTGRTLHIAGKPAANDRNGTWFYMQAMPHGRVTAQDDNFAKLIRDRYRHSNVYSNVTNPNDIYQLGDILVLPRRYGGNCLPLNEALSSGMPVVMPDIEPNNNILPKQWLFPAKIDGYFEPRTKVDLYSFEADNIRERIKWVQENITEQSKIANDIAETISWETLLPKYQEILS